MQAEFITPQDPRWAAFLKDIRHDFYHLPCYLDFCARHEGGTASAFYAREGDTAFLAPMLIRPLPPALEAPPDWVDAITPYGYPSPLLSGPADPDVLGRILEAFRAAASERGLVSAFFRLHPLLPLPVDGLSRYGDLRQHHGTVVIDLTRPLEELQNQTCRNHRSGIRKLKAAGFTAVLDDWDRMDEFIKLYIDTMNRVRATGFYFFPQEYFRDLRATLGDCLHLCTVQDPRTGVLASAALFTAINTDIIQLHLCGTASAYLPLAPTKLEIDFIRRWAKEAGYQALHLGGGVGNRADSLFHFKAGFSPVCKEFYTYRLVLDDNRYAELSRMWQARTRIPDDPTCDFFPLYRRPLGAGIWPIEKVAAVACC